MCNGEGGRQSQGGVIAVLKPTLVPGEDALKRELSLRLAQDASNGGTTASLDGFEANAGIAHILIHGHGDLRHHESDEAVLHRFDVPISVTGGAFPLANTLSLNAGGNGVVGRRVSFVRGGLVLGEGIIGWN
ncbi:hypothetical protein LTR85_002843 [Meristemomyces frigidus]|nr:hypothetical protein LTR85_002843 [Meristemomyces frigidus]